MKADKPRKRHQVPLTREEIEALVGRVFQRVYKLTTYGVEMYRVIDLTKSKKSVLVERVPLLTVGQDDPHCGGTRKIDLDFLEKNPVLDADGKPQRPQSARWATCVPRKIGESVVIKMSGGVEAYLLDPEELTNTFNYTTID